jgi:hypothetical protein
MGTTALTKPESVVRLGDLGRGGRGFGGGDRWEPERHRVRPRSYLIAMAMALAAIFMLFAAFTSALVVRKGLSSDWVSVPTPRVLWLNTTLLLVSSCTLEFSRRAHRGEGFARWLYLTTALGEAFVAGQLARQAVADQATVAAGEVVAEIAPGEDQVCEALRALYLVGTPQDSPDIERFARSVPGMSDRVRQQAALTAAAIRRRARGGSP